LGKASHGLFQPLWLRAAIYPKWPGTMSLEAFLRRVDEHRDELVERVREFLRMPSVSGTGEGIEETASFLRDFLADSLGASAELRRYGGHPIVYGVLDCGARHTLIYYNMYDVQPPEPLDKWVCPPFEARIVGDRLIARGAYNTKGALMSGLLGMELCLKELGRLPMNVVFLIEGEEELGSPSMPKAVEDLREDLSKASVTLFVMPTELVRGKPRVVLGNKGIVFVEVRSRTSEYDVHSSLGRGLYNPAAVLAKIVSSLLDPLKGPLPPWLEEDAETPTEADARYLRDIIESTPIEMVKELYGIRETRLSGEDLYREVFFRPNVNVDGFSSGYTGPGTKTIVPAEAVLRLDFRLVPNMDPEKVYRRFLEHVEGLGLSRLVEVELHDMYPPSKADPEGRAAEAARRAYRALGMRPYTIPMTPGSAPMYLFTRELGVDVVAAGPGHGGRAHAPNEYITLDTIPGIAKYAVVFMREFAELAERREPAKA